jgi:hypothetical protein
MDVKTIHPYYPVFHASIMESQDIGKERLRHLRNGNSRTFKEGSDAVFDFLKGRENRPAILPWKTMF